MAPAAAGCLVGLVLVAEVGTEEEDEDEKETEEAGVVSIVVEGPFLVEMVVLVVDGI